MEDRGRDRFEQRSRCGRRSSRTVRDLAQAAGSDVFQFTGGNAVRPIEIGMVVIFWAAINRQTVRVEMPSSSANRLDGVDGGCAGDGKAVLPWFRLETWHSSYTRLRGSKSGF